MNKKWMVLPVVLLAVFGLMFLGCGGDDGGGGTSGSGGDEFVAVTGITLSSTISTTFDVVDSPLTLAATVEPATATNKTIVWSLGTGSTAAGAAVADGKLTVTGKGTAVVTATITDGTAVGTPFTKDFTFTVVADAIVLNFAETDGIAVVAVGGTSEYIEGGYSFSRTVDYEAGYAYFKLDLSDYDLDGLADIGQVKFTLNGVSGDITYKNPILLASDTAFSGNLATTIESFVVNKPVGSGSSWDDGPQVGAGSGYPTNVTFDIWRALDSVQGLSGEVYFCIFMNGEKDKDSVATKIEITNVELVKTDAAIYDAVETITLAVNFAYEAAASMTLEPTVFPPFATKQAADITWSLGTGSSAEGAGVTSAGVVSFSGDGTVVAKATIAGGASSTEAYTQDFTINVYEGAAPDKATLTIGEDVQDVAVTGNGATSQIIYIENFETGDVGYEYKWGDGGNYGTVYSWFQVDLDTKTLDQFTSLKFSYQGVSGDIGWKDCFVHASATAFSGGYFAGNSTPASAVNNAKVDIGTVAGPGGNGTGVQNVTIPIDKVPAALAATAETKVTKVYLMIYGHMPNGTYRISNLELVAKAPAGGEEEEGDGE